MTAARAGECPSLRARRLAREEGKARVDPTPADCAAWVLAPHVAAWLREWERAGRVVLVPAGAGCGWVTPSACPLLRVAANELPLREELIPFLSARTGAKPAAFVACVHARRTPAWLRELMYADRRSARRDRRCARVSVNGALRCVSTTVPGAIRSSFPG